MDYTPYYEHLAEQLTARGVDVDAVKQKLKEQHIETPSWGFSNSGTRFKTFPYPGAARTTWEKLDDAGYVQKLVGIAPSVAIHIPWDKVDDYNEMKDYASERGITIGAVNPNLFQDNQYKLGSITNPSAAVREEALAHMVECCEIMEKVDSKLLSLWFADGTNYAGQDSVRARKKRMEAALEETYKHLPAGSRMLIEYKFFEPAFYHTDLPDWGTAYAMAMKLGEQAQVLVDTGHHAQGTNIGTIVAFLLDEGKLGGFHFNNRKYADDDLIVGSVNPFELFDIYVELTWAGDLSEDVAFMLDQCHYTESKVEAMLLSIINCQTAYAKSLIVDFDKLEAMQQNGDILGGHRTLLEAYETDVRPLLAQVRVEMGLDPDPIAVFKVDGYDEKIAKERGTADTGGGGFPG